MYWAVFINQRRIAMKADPSKGEVSIHGKVYLTVARRIDDFRKSEKFSSWSIETELVSTDNSLVVMKATIKDESGRVISTGFAEEDRSYGKINRTSAIENAETSCVGRALSFLGMAGTEIASADEVANAIAHGGAKDSMDSLLAHNKAVRDNLESITYIKEGIATGDMMAVAEAWGELDNETREALWRAPSNGGVFTTEERKTLKSDDFFNARKTVIAA